MTISRAQRVEWIDAEYLTNRRKLGSYSLTARALLLLWLLSLPSLSWASTIEGIWSGTYKCGSGTGHMEVLVQKADDLLRTDVIYNFGTNRGYFVLSGKFVPGNTLLDTTSWKQRPTGHVAPLVNVKYRPADDKLFWQFRDTCTPVMLSRASKMVRLSFLPPNLAAPIEQKINQLAVNQAEASSSAIDLPSGIWVFGGKPNIRYRLSGKVMMAETPMGPGRPIGTEIFRIGNVSGTKISGEWYFSDRRWRAVSGHIDDSRIVLRGNTGEWTISHVPTTAPDQHSNANPETSSENDNPSLHSVKQSFKGVGRDEDIILGIYEGTYKCGVPGSDFHNSTIKVTLHTVKDVSGARYDAEGLIEFHDPNTGQKIHQGDAAVSGIPISTRKLHINWAREQPNGTPKAQQVPDLSAIQYQFEAVFDGIFETIRLTPIRSSLGVSARCRSATLKKIEGPTNSSICQKVKSWDVMGDCLAQALEGNDEDQDKLATHQLDSWRSSNGIYVPRCDHLNGAVHSLAGSAMRIYSMRFAKLPKRCNDVLIVAAALGIQNPVQKECERLPYLQKVQRCIKAIAQTPGLLGPLETALRQDGRKCSVQGGAPSALQSILVSRVTFDEKYDGRKDARLRKMVTCDFYFEAAAAIGLVSAVQLEERRNAARTANEYRCSEERGSKQPNRQDMIKALGHELSRQCSADMTFLRWLDGTAPPSTPLTVALFDFSPTKTTCEMRSRLTTNFADPAFVFWITGYENTVCQPIGPSQFSCLGDFNLGYRSNDMRLGAAELEQWLSSNMRGKLAAHFHFDRSSCAWRASNFQK